MNKAILILCVITLALAISCQKEQPKMTILTENYPPLTFAVADSISGFATDVLRAIQDDLGTNDEIVLLDWAEAYQRALDEKNVVIYTMEQTPERKDLFHWIGPLGNHSSSLYVKKDSGHTLQNIYDAKTIGNIATTTAWFTEKHLESLGFTNLLSSPQPADGVKAVMDGKAEATILSDLVAEEIISLAGYEPGVLVPILEVIKTDYYIAVSKNTDAAIVNKWEKAFRNLSSSGAIDQLRKKWFE